MDWFRVFPLWLSVIGVGSIYGYPSPEVTEQYLRRSERGESPAQPWLWDMDGNVSISCPEYGYYLTGNILSEFLWDPERMIAASTPTPDNTARGFTTQDFEKSNRFSQVIFMLKECEDLHGDLRWAEYKFGRQRKRELQLETSERMENIKRQPPPIALELLGRTLLGLFAIGRIKRKGIPPTTQKEQG